MSPSDGGTDPSSGAGCGDHGDGEEINAHYHHRQNHRPLWWPSGWPRRSPGAVACPSAASMEMATPDPMSVVLASVSPAACPTSWCAMGAIQIEHGHERRRAPLPALLICRRRLAHRRPAEWSTSGAAVPAVTCASLRRQSVARPRFCRAPPGHAAQMENNYPSEYPLYAREHSLFKDLTNTTTKGDGAPHLQQKRGHWSGVACSNVR